MAVERGGILKSPFRALMEMGMVILVQVLAEVKLKKAATMMIESSNIIAR